MASASEPTSKRQRRIVDNDESNFYEVLSPVKTVRFTLPLDAAESDIQKAHGFFWRVDTAADSGFGLNLRILCLDVPESSLSRAKYTYGKGPWTSKTFERRLGDKRDDYDTKSFHRCVEDDGSLNLGPEGELTIGVNKQVYKQVWFPKPAIQKDKVFHELFGQGCEEATVLLVGEERAKFLVHKSVVLNNAPVLHDFLKDVQTGQEFEIPDVSSSLFQTMLEHIYTGALPKLDLDDKDDGAAIAFAKTLLLKSNYYGLSTLKLHIESALAAKVVDETNAAEWLILADTYSCALMKESCMDMYVDYTDEVKASTGWKTVMDSPKLLCDLLDHYRIVETRHTDDTFMNMNVSMLRTTLEKLNLEVDGTRDAMIERLVNHHNGALGYTASGAAKKNKRRPHHPVSSGQYFSLHPWL